MDMKIVSRRQLVETIVNGHLDVIEFLHDQGVDLNCYHFMWEIGQRGKASSLHWMASKGIISNKSLVFNYLVQNGEIDILKESYEDSSEYIDKYTFLACARGGNVEVMNWLLQQKNCEWDLSLFTEAARGGSIPMMELCLRKGCPPREDICSSAMENWNHEAAFIALKWLRENNVPWNERVCENAAEYGDLKALKWARENGCPWDEETFYYAARQGNVDILDYCFQNNCPMAHDIDYHVNFDSVAYFDDTLTPTDIFTPTELKEKSLKLYMWLHQHAVPWDKYSTLKTAREGHWKTLMWAIDNGCPCHEDILGYVIGKSNIPILEYYLQHLALTNDTAYVFVMNKMKEAHDVTDKDMITMLQKIHDYGIPWSRDIIPCAERLGRSNVASWLRCVGCPQ
ncbi:hypothetical protein CTEN210_13662 [Chaetoceros tenuissimus]|uniref:Uncharacterized protein n=1 Tax=Chaetoceros tenuissimus TaxID=426638 RepID=A0AAD3D5Q7_9STRA|nr:hypothetical protein CTEN210_13662 [Chaetoceros tenuissimus]